jgi:membrane protein implicated in regulation of membrane protease activity
VVRNLARMIEKAGFAIFMFSLVAAAIGLAKGYTTIAIIGGAIVLVCGLIVLFRANRAVSKRPKRPSTGEAATSGTTKSSSSRRSSSISDPDRY